MGRHHLCACTSISVSARADLRRRGREACVLCQLGNVERDTLTQRFRKEVSAKCAAMPKRQVTAVDLDQVTTTIDRFNSFWYSLGMTSLPMISQYLHTTHTSYTSKKSVQVVQKEAGIRRPLSADKIPPSQVVIRQRRKKIQKNAVRNWGLRAPDRVPKCNCCWYMIIRNPNPIQIMKHKIMRILLVEQPTI